MKCDKCKEEHSYWGMICIKWTNANRHWFTGTFRSMKALVCKSCFDKA